MNDFSWAEILTLVIAIVGGVAGLLTKFDKRLDKLEADFNLLLYRMGELESSYREDRKTLEKAVSNLTAFLAAKGDYQPRSFRSDGTPWPTDDTPTMGHPRIN